MYQCILFIEKIFSERYIVYNSKHNEMLLTIHQNIMPVLVFQVLAGAEGKAS